MFSGSSAYKVLDIRKNPSAYTLSADVCIDVYILQDIQIILVQVCARIYTGEVTCKTHFIRNLGQLFIMRTHCLPHRVICRNQPLVSIVHAGCNTQHGNLSERGVIACLVYLNGQDIGIGMYAAAYYSGGLGFCGYQASAHIKRLHSFIFLSFQVL
jgi:hypothetical protein